MAVKHMAVERMAMGRMAVRRMAVAHNPVTTPCANCSNQIWPLIPELHSACDGFHGKTALPRQMRIRPGIVSYNPGSALSFGVVSYNPCIVA